MVRLSEWRMYSSGVGLSVAAALVFGEYRHEHVDIARALPTCNPAPQAERKDDPHNQKNLI
jgi:hypothetical protein